MTSNSERKGKRMNKKKRRGGKGWLVQGGKRNKKVEEKWRNWMEERKSEREGRKDDGEL